MESVSRLRLIELAFDLCKDWKKLGHVLGLSGKVDRISEDYRKNGVSEQAYRMLQEWKQQKGAEATYEVLGRALRQEPLLRVDLAEKYCEGGRKDSLDNDAVHRLLPKPLKSEQLSGGDLNQLSNELGKAWMWVGRLLGLDDSSLDGIKEAHDHQYEWCHEMLALWTQRNTTQATYQWLAQALLHEAVSKRDLAEKYCILHREQGTDLTLFPLAPDNCIRKKFISILPNSTWGELVVKLGPGVKGYFKDLAVEMGYSMDRIMYLESQKSPVESLRKHCSDMQC
ncbi:hypothetical protein P5673_008768 [Acropora cervicornis]|uniref:Death domain-containing protein n=1 Tax=Acropora cervicornis TaxID=6130 RepID=A0AAD9QT45_ACRCE|nr:hypothetical protein P5673_008768 [Acropora cervicornis]